MAATRVRQVADAGRHGEAGACSGAVGRPSACRGTRLRASSQRRRPRRATRRRPPARRRTARDDRAGGQLEAVAALGDAGSSGARRCAERGRPPSRRRESRRPPSRVRLRRAVSSDERPGATSLPLREDADAAAEQLGVRQDVRAEEHRAALDRAAAGSARAPRGGRPGRGRTSARRGSRAPGSFRAPARTDPLDHALRVLADRAPAIGAEADVDRGPRPRACADPRRCSRTAPRSSSAVLRRSGGRRRSGFSGRNPSRRRAPQVARRTAQQLRAPDVGRSRFSSSLSVVLLPAPFGPSRPNTPPAGISNDRPSSARCGRGRQKPVRKSLVRRSVRTAVASSLVP